MSQTKPDAHLRAAQVSLTQALELDRFGLVGPELVRQAVSHLRICGRDDFDALADRCAGAFDYDTSSRHAIADVLADIERMRE